MFWTQFVLCFVLEKALCPRVNAGPLLELPDRRLHLLCFRGVGLFKVDLSAPLCFAGSCMAFAPRMFRRIMHPVMCSVSLHKTPRDKFPQMLQTRGLNLGFFDHFLLDERVAQDWPTRINLKTALLFGDRCCYAFNS